MKRPFNFLEFIAGVPAETKRGVKVIGHYMQSEDLTYPLDARLESGHQLSYTKSGIVVSFGDNMDDLVMSDLINADLNLKIIVNTQILEDLKTAGAELYYGCKSRKDIESDDCSCDENGNCTLSEFVGIKLPIENAAIITKFAELTVARAIVEIDELKQPKWWALNFTDENDTQLFKRKDDALCWQKFYFEDGFISTIEALFTTNSSEQISKAFKDALEQAAQICDDLADELNIDYQKLKEPYYEGGISALDRASRAIRSLNTNQER